MAELGTRRLRLSSSVLHQLWDSYILHRSGNMPKGIDRYQVQEMLTEGAQLVEVLPQEEYGSWHLPGAINIPLKELNQESIAQLDKERPVIVYCADNQ